MLLKKHWKISTEMQIFLYKRDNTFTFLSSTSFFGFQKCVRSNLVQDSQFLFLSTFIILQGGTKVITLLENAITFAMAPNVNSVLTFSRLDGINSNGFLLRSISFVVVEIWKRFIANDIQSRCRNLREMKDVFKKLKVLGRKGKSCTARS